jgi:hypothetical protein
VAELITSMGTMARILETEQLAQRVAALENRNVSRT